MPVPAIRAMLSGARPKPVASGWRAMKRTWKVRESSSEARKVTGPRKIGSMSGTITHASSSFVPAPRVERTALEMIGRPGMSA